MLATNASNGLSINTNRRKARQLQLPSHAPRKQLVACDPERPQLKAKRDSSTYTLLVAHHTGHDMAGNPLTALSRCDTNPTLLCAPLHMSWPCVPHGARKGLPSSSSVWHSRLTGAPGCGPDQPAAQRDTVQAGRGTGPNHGTDGVAARVSVSCFTHEVDQAVMRCAGLAVCAFAARQ